MTKREGELKKDIEYLESNQELLRTQEQLLYDKKLELENLREIKTKGEMVRSRLQWLSEGEKPSKCFCGLENRNFVDKTIKKVKLYDGSFVTNQKEVLHHTKEFYSDLFDGKCVKDDSYIFEILENSITKTTDDESLGEPILVEELGIVLKKMKSNKTPGIDGITAEFLKVFLGKLKYFISNAINHSYKKAYYLSLFEHV